MDSSAIIINSGDGEVRVVGDFVVVTLTSMLDLSVVEAMLGAVDAKLQEHGLLWVLVDRRGLEPPAEEADELYRAWIEGCVYHDRVAVLVRSGLEGVARDGRVSSGQDHVRWFCEPRRAIEWLCEASPPETLGSAVDAAERSP